MARLQFIYRCCLVVGDSLDILKNRVVVNALESKAIREPRRFFVPQGHFLWA